jgi:uncharacterized phage-associated protein
MLFNERKAAHVAAFFLHKGNGKLDILKLMKLMYLAERESFAKFGEPMIGDWLCSMEHGPVLSRTLNHMNGTAVETDGNWDSWVGDKENHKFALRKSVNDPRKDLGSLSDAELAILTELWGKYGHLTGYELRDLTHDICTEWEDPDGSSYPIPIDRLLKVLGNDAATSKELFRRVAARRRIEKLLTSPE